MSERQRDATRKREQRAKTRDVAIPRCADRARRRRLERNDQRWLRWYCADCFTYDFTAQQKEMIAAIRRAVTIGGDQAIAASRGEGKTTLSERLLLKYALQGVISFAVLFAATGSDAADSLEEIKQQIEENDRLAADYPEVCTPVRALESIPSRAHYQTVSGYRHDTGKKYLQVSSRFSWCGREVTFPNVPGSPSRGAIFATRGLDSAVRGLKKRGRRPDVAVIDDPDTEDTANSAEQATKLEKRIDRAIGGLGGQARPIARVMLTTLQSRTAVSYRFTDPKAKPWKGRRFRFLVKPPDRAELWDEYVHLRLADIAEGDDFGRRAHRFYLKHRRAMDAGAEVGNVHRFNAERLEDGTQREVSALQHYYNQIARLGPEAVATEFDNNPPADTGLDVDALSAYRIQRQLSGHPRAIVPAGCTVLTQGIDVRKTALHWVVRAWTPACVGYTIDYGVTEVHDTVVGSDEGLDVALIRAIRTRCEDLLGEPYRAADGQVHALDLTLVDAGWRTAAIVEACQAIGRDWRPAMGYGKSAGCAQANFTDVATRSRTKRPGDGWFESKGSYGWLVALDADRWKSFEHDRWRAAPGAPGSLQLWGDNPADRQRQRLSDDEKRHHAYARHIVAEREVEEITRGQLRRHFKSFSRNNHWLDASYMSCAAARMCGIELVRYARRRPRRSLGELAAAAHG